MRSHIAERFVRDADIAFNHGEEIGVFFAGDVQPDKGKTQSFRINFGEPACHSAGRCPAQVGVVGHRAHVADKLSRPIERRDHHHVHDVLAAAKGIIGDDDVAVIEWSTAQVLQRLGHGQRRAGEKHRRVLGLHDHSAMPIEEGAGEVLHFLDNGGACGPHQGRRHVIRNRFQGVADNLRLHALAQFALSTVAHHVCPFLHAWSLRTSRFSQGSTVAVQYGGISAALP